jgi:hypothetical protein
MTWTDFVREVTACSLTTKEMKQKVKETMRRLLDEAPEYRDRFIIVMLKGQVIEIWYREIPAMRDDDPRLEIFVDMLSRNKGG